MSNNIKLAACIVETRSYESAVKAINEHLEFLPKDTHVFYFMGIKAFKKLESQKEWPSEFPKNITIFPIRNPDFDIKAYNEMLTDKFFWKLFVDNGFNRVLIFQTDSKILRSGIEEFYEWSAIGSPWNWQEHGFNGGLSLRHPKIMYHICHNFSWDITKGNEDVFFSNVLHEYPNIGQLAPREACMKFGVEAVFALGTFGIHAIDKYLTKEQCNQILN